MGCGSCGSRYKGFTQNSRLRKLQRRRVPRPGVAIPKPDNHVAPEESKPTEAPKNE